MDKYEPQPRKKNILNEIFERKRKELDLLKRQVTLKELQQKVEKHYRTVRNFGNSLENSPNISLIAEIKKASPSRGDINTSVNIVEQAKKYELAGASAISILTDIDFKGDISFINEIREVTTVPLLRKDFIFDPYQVYESYLAGADAILLIATQLDEKTLIELVDLTHKLGMECLVEVHTREDLQKALKTKAKIIGINARNLETMDVNLDNIVKLIGEVPKDRLVVAESGIETGKDVRRLAKLGARAILVGTTLMKSSNVEAKVRELCIKL